MRERATIFVIGDKCINVKLLNFQRICKKISGRMHRKVCNEFSIEFEFLFVSAFIRTSYTHIQIDVAMCGHKLS